jgi:LL-diaminopimelate aminotransferase
MLDEASVLVSPGDSYGPSGAGYVRLSLTVPDSRLDEAVDRITKALVILQS